MKQKILIEAGQSKFKAELNDEIAPETFKKLSAALPIESTAQTWGEEIYFTVAFDNNAENATKDLSVGNIAFWPDGPALAIFFGKTPMSTGEKPVPYSPCNLVGKLLNVAADKEKLLKVKVGEKIVVKASE